MFRDLTFNDVSRLDTLHEECVGFVMDEDTFRAFYDRTARGVWAYLARVTGDRQMADDLLQETYYRFLRAAATHSSEEHRRNSLYCIATNLARDVRRRNLLRATDLAGHDIERVSGDHRSGAPEQDETDVTLAPWRVLKPREQRNSVAGLCGRQLASRNRGGAGRESGQHEDSVVSRTA